MTALALFLALRRAAVIARREVAAWVGGFRRVTFHTVRPEVPDLFLPRRATADAVGYDLRAWLPDPHTDLVIQPGAQVMLATGVRVDAAPGWHVKIYDRSSHRRGGLIQGGTAVIDRDYGGELFIVARNIGTAPVKIAHGDRFTQITIERTYTAGDEGGPVRAAGDAGAFGSTDARARAIAEGRT